MPGVSDYDAFGVLWEVRASADQACADAIGQLRAEGFSWAFLSHETGLSRQGLAQWYGRRSERSECKHLLTPDIGGEPR